jgi:hypothetical protein
MFKKSIVALSLALLLASSAFAQGIINGGILGGAKIGNPNFPTILQGLQAWYSADRGCYTDAACQLPASDKSWLQIADASQTGLDIATQDLVVCFWVKMDSYTGYRVLVAKGGNVASDLGWMLMVDTNGKIRLQYTASGLVISSAGSTVMGTTAWRFVALHMDRSGSANIYLDGSTTPESTLNISATVATDLSNAKAFCVGASSEGVLYDDGRIDSLMVFKGADLSAVAPTIISWAYNAGSGRLCSDITDAQKTAWGAISGWELGETAGNRYDSWTTNTLSQSFSELVANGTFTDSSTGWTEGAGWAYGTNNEAGTAAEGDLAQTTVVPTVGKLYTTSFTTAVTSGTVRLNFGGVTGLTRSTSATHAEAMRATSTASIVIDPVAAYTGTVDTVSVMAASILNAPGIVRGLSADANFATQLDGNSQYYSYTGTAFDPGTGSFSLALCNYFDKLQSSYLVSAGSTANDSQTFGLYLYSTGRLSLVLNNGSGAFLECDTAVGAIAIGAWNTIIVTADRDGVGDDNVVITINGVTALTESIASKAGACAPGKLFVGRYSESAANYVAGRMDNVCYINRVLTAPEITFLHNNGEWRQWAELGVAGTDGAALTSSVVKGFLEFDNKTALGTDSSGNGNTFTVNGTPTQGWGVNYLAGVCSYWQDLSGNGNHGLSSALATRMSYCTGVLNGKPVLCGDGVDDYMTTTLAGLPAATIFFVGKISAANDVPYGVMDTQNRSHLGANGSDFWGGGVAAQGYNVIYSDVDPGTAFFGSLQYDGSTVKLYHNGTSKYSANQSGVVSTALTYAIGARRTGAALLDEYLDGQIAEIITYNRALPDTERKFIERALSYKWGIAP